MIIQLEHDIAQSTGKYKAIYKKAVTKYRG